MRGFIMLLFLIVSSSSVYAALDVRVEVHGLSGELAKNVRLFLSVEQQAKHPLLTESRLRRLHIKAEQEIRKSLQPFGFYQPQIQSQLVHRDEGSWQAKYTVDAGVPIRIGMFDLRISGAMKDDEEFLKFQKKLPLARGEVFNHGKYEAIKSKIAAIASERGYFNAFFSQHRVEVDLKAYDVRVFLHYESGIRFNFGEVVLEQDVLDAPLLQRYIPFETGSPYNFAELVELQQALNDSDYFNRVEVAPGDLQQQLGQVPIIVKLTPRKKHRFGFGLGYGTDTGARARATWEVPRINRKGHRFDSELRVSQIGFSLSTQYLVPVLNPRTDQISYKAAVINEYTATSESSLRTLGVGVNHGRGPWRESLTLDFQQEDYQIADVSDLSYLLIPGVSWRRVWGDKQINTRDGVRFSLGLRGASQRLLSDSDFAQLRSDIKAITSLGEKNRVIMRGTVGSSITGEFEQLPSSVRFFAGGAQSVRGFGYQHLGPKDENDKVIGGKHLMVGSIEFERRFAGKWGAAVFYDLGNAIDRFDDKLEQGAGIGIRWQSPVGPIRLDVASAIRREGYPIRLHINVGPDL